MGIAAALAPWVGGVVRGRESDQWFAHEIAPTVVGRDLGLRASRDGNAERVVAPNDQLLEKGISPHVGSRSGWGRLPIHLRFVEGKRLFLVRDLEMVRHNETFSSLAKPSSGSPSTPPFILPLICPCVHAATHSTNTP